MIIFCGYQLLKKIIVDNAVGSTGSQIFWSYLLHSKLLYYMISFCGYHLLKKLIVDNAVDSTGKTSSIIWSYLIYLCLRVTSMFGCKYSGKLKTNWTEDPSSNQTFLHSKSILYEYSTKTFPVSALLRQDQAQTG